MSLRAALLLLLASEPLTGYDVTKRFAASVGHVWHAPDSQIYPELRKLEREGLATGRDVPWGGKGATKREYAVTDAGLAFVREWQAAPLRYAPERDPARLRAAYFEWASRDGARAQLEAHRVHFRAEREQAQRQIDAIESREHATFARRLEHYDPAEHERLARWRVFAYEGSIERADAEIAWAERGLAMLGDEPAEPAEYLGDAAGPSAEPGVSG